MKFSVLGVAGAVVASLLVATPAHADGACDTYLLVGARGTDERPKGSDPYNELNWDGSGVLANRIFDTLGPIVVANGGTISRYGVRYAADMDLGGFATEVANAEYSWAFENEWDAGVAVGADDAVDKIETTYAACPGTKYILVGYSQGADVVGAAIDELSPTLRSRIAATALFGDPRFNPNDAAANLGTYVGHNSGMFAARPGRPSSVRRCSPIVSGWTSPASRGSTSTEPHNRSRGPGTSHGRTSAALSARMIGTSGEARWRRRASRSISRAPCR